MRIRWIDVLKGILISLVVLGHSNINYDAIKIIYAFHMPLFFMVSGYLIKLETIDSEKQWMKENIKKYMLPYFAFLIVNSCISLDNDSVFDIPKKILRGGYGGALTNGVYWFITVLLLGSIVLILIENYVKRKEVKAFIYLLMFFSVTLISRFLIIDSTSVGGLLIKLPWGLFNVPLAVCYLKIGNFIRSRQLFETYKWLSAFWIILAIGISIYIIMAYPGKVLPIDMKYSQYGDCIINLMMPLSMWFALKCVSKKICDFNIIESMLSLIGQSSLVIMYRSLSS